MADPVIDEGKLSAWDRWELARFDGPGDASPGRLKTDKPPELQMPTAESIERIHLEAHRQGFEAGREEGHRAGYASGQANAHGEASRLAGVATRLEQALAGFNAEVADELLALAIELARETVRGEISARPDVLLNIVREALGQLPHQHASIFLNPEDASLLRSYMGDQLTHAGHRIHEDTKLAPGDCVLEAGGTHIDASVATRWRRVLGGLGIASAWQPEQEKLI